MPGTIEIKDQDAEGFLKVELPELLTLLEPQGRELVWSVLDLESTADPDRFKKDLLKLEQDIHQSTQGLILDWNELVSLANSLSEVRDAIIVGCRNRELIPTLPAIQIYSSCEIVIEAVDSLLWRIYAVDDRILRQFQDVFRDVKVTPSAPFTPN